MTRCVRRARARARAALLGRHPLHERATSRQKRAALRAGRAPRWRSARPSPAELRAAGVPRVEVIPNIVDPGETRRAGRARRRRSRCPSASCCSSASSRRTRARACSCPAVAAARTGPAAGGAGRGDAGPRAEVRRRVAGRRRCSCAAGRTREDVLRAMARATALVFPSLWPEPLSRVLLEALALGTPIAAMDTGGTREILEDGASGLLVRPTRAELARGGGAAGRRRRAARATRARARARAPGLRARGAGPALRGRVPEAAREGRAALAAAPIRCTARAAWSARSTTWRSHLQRAGRRDRALHPARHARRRVSPARWSTVRYARLPAGRHGRVLDRTLQLPALRPAPGRGGGRAGARGGPSTSCTRRA